MELGGGRKCWGPHCIFTWVGIPQGLRTSGPCPFFGQRTQVSRAGEGESSPELR
jgi:hypothetical protein